MKLLSNLDINGASVAVRDGTLQTNLNADKLGGYSPSDFVKANDVGNGTGDMVKSVYDKNNNGKVDVAESADSVPWTGVTGKPTTFTPSAHTHAISDVTNLQTSLDDNRIIVGTVQPTRGMWYKVV